MAHGGAKESRTGGPRRMEHMSCWPPKGILRGVLAGSIMFNLNDNTVTLPGDMGNDSMKGTKGNLGVDHYESVVVIIDQPAVLILDDGEGEMPLFPGVNVFPHTPVYDHLEVSCYMPNQLAIYLGKGEIPHMSYKSQDLEFKRNASYSGQNIATFDNVVLRPVDFTARYIKVGGSSGLPEVARVFPNNFEGENQGAPIVGNIVEKQLAVKNTGDVAVIVKGQARQWEDHTYYDLDDVFGPNGTWVEVGEHATFDIAQSIHQFKLLTRTDGANGGAEFDLRGKFSH